MVPRNKLRPGQVFAWPTLGPPFYVPTAMSVLVVLDEKHEADFWRGRGEREWCVGDVCPDAEVEVLS